MASRLERNRKRLTEVFSRGETRHAVLIGHPPPEGECPPDYTTSRRPVREWVPHLLRDYERRVAWLDALDHDDVPYVCPATHTGVFAAAFGCPVHTFEGSNPAAGPIVRTPAEADGLRKPRLDTPPLNRVFELADLLRERLGPDAPISVPDIQSPFDIAAIVWRKEDLYMAMRDAPEAVQTLEAKCHALLEEFLTEFLKRHPAANLVHCPSVWAPNFLGCSLSEDEAGCMSSAMFARFCLPTLAALSQRFGGLFLHCCADADHQYPAFLSVPNLRSMNRVFTRDPATTICAFAGRAALTVA